MFPLVEGSPWLGGYPCHPIRFLLWRASHVVARDQVRSLCPCSFQNGRNREPAARYFLFRRFGFRKCFQLFLVGVCMWREPVPRMIPILILKAGWNSLVANRSLRICKNLLTGAGGVGLPLWLGLFR